MDFKKVDVVILGVGTAGLSAAKEVAKVTRNFVLIQHGPTGTTCARVGCMPSKALIAVANAFHPRKSFAGLGLADNHKPNGPRILEHVRKLRDSFVGSVLDSSRQWDEVTLSGATRFLDPTSLEVGGHTRISTKRTIIATGSSPVVPESWGLRREEILTSDEIFELKDLPGSINLIGLGAIGLELGQALSRLGVKVQGYSSSTRIGGCHDSEVNRRAVEYFSTEFPLHLGREVDPKKLPPAEKYLVAIGRRPNLSGLGLEEIGVPFDENGVPRFDPNTMQVEGLPLYLAGDVGNYRPLLHEAADEGRIAGYNSVRATTTAFARRAALSLTFTDPGLAEVGERWSDLPAEDTVVGEASFEDQGRAKVMGENHGLLRVYVDRFTSQLRGAALMAPDAEHLAHLLAWAVQQELTVFQALQMPFYHPVLEEAVRTALREAARQTERPHGALELALCDESGVDCLS